jgi:hypothetical protein
VVWRRGQAQPLVGSPGDVTPAGSGALLGRSVVGCALAPRIHRSPSTPGDRADSRAAGSGLRPRGRAASGVVASSEVTTGSRPNRGRRPPWRTAATFRPARPAGTGAVVDDLGAAQPVGPATGDHDGGSDRHQIRAAVGCGHGRHRAETPVDVQIIIAGRWRVTYVFPG